MVNPVLFLYLNPEQQAFSNIVTVEDVQQLFATDPSAASNLLATTDLLPAEFDVEVFLSDNKSITNSSILNQTIRAAMSNEGFTVKELDLLGAFHPTIYQSVALTATNQFTLAHPDAFQLTPAYLQAGDWVKLLKNGHESVFVRVTEVVDAATFRVHHPSFPRLKLCDNLATYILYGIKLVNAERLAKISYLRYASTASGPVVIQADYDERFNPDLYRLLYPDARMFNKEEAYLDYINRKAVAEATPGEDPRVGVLSDFYDLKMPVPIAETISNNGLQLGEGVPLVVNGPTLLNQETTANARTTFNAPAVFKHHASFSNTACDPLNPCPPLTAAFYGRTTFAGDTQHSGLTQYRGDTTYYDQTTYEGDVLFKGGFEHAALAQFQDVRVTGTAELQDEVRATQALHACNLDVLGASSFSNDAVFAADVTHAGHTHMQSADLQGALRVLGAPTVLSNADPDPATDALTVYGNLTVAQGDAVFKHAALDTGTARDWTVTETLRSEGEAALSNATVHGTLVLRGHTYVLSERTSFCNAVDLAADLHVAQTIETSNLVVSGDAHFQQAVRVDASLEVPTLSASNVHVHAQTTLDGSTRIQGAELVVEAPARFTDTVTVGSNLLTPDGISAGLLSATGTATFLGPVHCGETLHVDRRADFSNDTHFHQAATFHDGMEVLQGGATFRVDVGFCNDTHTRGETHTRALHVGEQATFCNSLLAAPGSVARFEGEVVATRDVTVCNLNVLGELRYPLLSMCNLQVADAAVFHGPVDFRGTEVTVSNLRVTNNLFLGDAAFEQNVLFNNAEFTGSMTANSMAASNLSVTEAIDTVALDADVATIRDLHFENVSGFSNRWIVGDPTFCARLSNYEYLSYSNFPNDAFVNAISDTTVLERDLYVSGKLCTNYLCAQHFVIEAPESYNLTISGTTTMSNLQVTQEAFVDTMSVCNLVSYRHDSYIVDAEKIFVNDLHFVTTNIAGFSNRWIVGDAGFCARLSNYEYATYSNFPNDDYVNTFQDTSVMERDLYVGGKVVANYLCAKYFMIEAAPTFCNEMYVTGPATFCNGVFLTSNLTSTGDAHFSNLAISGVTRLETAAASNLTVTGSTQLAGMAATASNVLLQAPVTFTQTIVSEQDAFFERAVVHHGPTTFSNQTTFAAPAAFDTLFVRHTLCNAGTAALTQVEAQTLAVSGDARFAAATDFQGGATFCNVVQFHQPVLASDTLILKHVEDEAPSVYLDSCGLVKNTVSITRHAKTVLETYAHVSVMDFSMGSTARAYILVIPSFYYNVLNAGNMIEILNNVFEIQSITVNAIENTLTLKLDNLLADRGSVCHNIVSGSTVTLSLLGDVAGRGDQITFVTNQAGTGNGLGSNNGFEDFRDDLAYRRVYVTQVEFAPTTITPTLRVSAQLALYVVGHPYEDMSRLIGTYISVATARTPQLVPNVYKLVAVETAPDAALRLVFKDLVPWKERAPVSVLAPEAVPGWVDLSLLTVSLPDAYTNISARIFATTLPEPYLGIDDPALSASVNLDATRTLSFAESLTLDADTTAPKTLPVYNATTDGSTVFALTEETGIAAAGGSRYTSLSTQFVGHPMKLIFALEQDTPQRLRLHVKDTNSAFVERVTSFIGYFIYLYDDQGVYVFRLKRAENSTFYQRLLLDVEDIGLNAEQPAFDRERLRVVYMMPMRYREVDVLSQVHFMSPVGVLTTHPLEALSVNGDFSCRQRVLLHDAESATYAMTFSNQVLTLGNNDLMLGGETEVLVGKDLQANGSVIAQNFLQTSDVRMKRNFVATEAAADLRTLEQIRVHEFELMEPAAALTRRARRRRGVVAQELETIPSLADAVRETHGIIPYVCDAVPVELGPRGRLALKLPLDPDTPGYAHHTLRPGDRLRLRDRATGVILPASCRVHGVDVVDAEEGDAAKRGLWVDLDATTMAAAQLAPSMERYVVLGYEDAYKTVDTDALLMLCINAIQSLSSKVRHLEQQKQI